MPEKSKVSSPRCLLLLVMQLLCCSAALSAGGMPVVVEFEPNDQPHQAIPFSAPVTLSGSMGGYDQDAFLWRISDADALKRWNLTLHGIPEALTGVSIVRVDYGPDPNAPEGGDAEEVVIGANSLLRFGIRDGSRPVTKHNVFFPAGDYIVGLFQAGTSSPGYQPPKVGGAIEDAMGSGTNAQPEIKPNAYRLMIEPGLKTYFATPVSHATRDTATNLRVGGSYSTITSGESWHAVDINDAQASKLWTLQGEVMLEHKLTARLLDAKGVELGTAKSDRTGHFELPNLALSAGRYFVELDAPGDSPSSRSIRITESGAVVEGSEREPNDFWVRANVIDWSAPLTGKIDKAGEKDYFQFQVSETDQTAVFDLTLEAPEATYAQFCLLTAEGVRRTCRAGSPPLTLDTLNLNSGVHGVVIERSKGSGSYTLTKAADRPIAAGQELEPNDLAGDATPFGQKRIIKGTLPSGDVDFFTLSVTEQPQLWRLQAIGTGLRDLSYLPQHGRSKDSVRASTSSRRLRLDNLFLLPGTHTFSLGAAKDTSYVLRALPLGPPSLNAERESNGARARAQHITIGRKIVGLLTETSDYDYYRFHLPARQYARLNLTPPADAQLRMSLYWDGGRIKQFYPAKGEAVDNTLLLEPGDYYLQLTAYDPSEAEYELNITTPTELVYSTDVEPNDYPAIALPMPTTLVIDGNVGSSRAGVDWYRLPVPDGGQRIRIKGSGDPRIQIVNRDRKKIGSRTEVEPGIVDVELSPSADKEMYARVYGKGEYRYEFDFLSTAAAATEEAAQTRLPLPSSLPLNLTFTEGNRTVAAYRSATQRLDIAATLKNSGTTAMAVQVAATTSDDKWIATLSKSTATIGPGETQTLPIRINILADAWPDIPVTLRLVASDDANRHAMGSLTLNAERQITLRDGAFGFELPTELQGSINVANSAFGAELITKESDGQKYLNDGMTTIGHYFSTKRVHQTGPGKSQPVIELAGDQRVDVIGFSFHPFGLQDGQPAQRNAQEVEVALSSDGIEFETALKTELSAQTREQAFVLTEAKPARFARLTLVSSRDVNIATLGEWKVLGKRDSIGSLELENIAAPELGGHVVWSSPAWPNYSYDVTMLTPKDDAQSWRPTRNGRYEWVIGFQNNRAAKIRALTWRDGEDIGKQRFARTEVYGSTASPLGPWTSLGQWDILAGQKNVLEFASPAWVRFLRFVAEPAAGATWLNTPDQLEVLEARGDGELSILGEWGQNSALGPYEKGDPPRPLNPQQDRPAHISRATALALKSGQPVHSRVSLGNYYNWYRVNVPAGHNSLRVVMTGQPTVNATAGFVAANGDAKPWSSTEHLPDSTTYLAYVDPGNYFIEVVEPPRSVIFTWDTSGSTAAMRSVIRQAVLGYVQDVKPGIDEAHMLPFGGTFLSRRWLDQPYMLQQVLNEYDGAGDSSAAESALVQAAEKLRKKPGQKVIVVVTDAATSRDYALWDTLADVRPRIIALGVSSRGAFSSNPPREQDLLQDWAASSNGYYEYVENVGSLERAFDRASARIRQPAEYQIVATTQLQEPMSPGYLQVVSGAGDGGADLSIKLPQPAIEVILDASGSMLKRMGNKRRYQVAREVLKDLINNKLPENVHFGLRVFGHTEAGSCRTDLEMPIGPLDRNDAIGKLDAIIPKNLAKTPIAASLTAAANDLKSTEGEATLLLITDGEETCDGDPEQAITKLRESGVDAVVNIIGFAIDDDELDAKFRRWAKLGSGTYRQATDAESLAASIEQLSRRPFNVINSNGEVFGPFYSDGEPIEFPAGEYTVDFGNRVAAAELSPSETVTVEIKP